MKLRRLPSAAPLLAAALLWLAPAGCDLDPGAKSGPTPQPVVETPPPEPSAPAGTEVYDCGRDYRFTVRSRPDGSVQLLLPDARVVLKPVGSPSGDRYEGDGYMFWRRGRQCRLQTPEAIYAGCDSDIELAIWEDARLRGLDFLALGYGPDWRLEIVDGRRMTMTVGTASERYEFPTPERIAQTDGLVTYRGLLSGHGLEVTIRDQACRDRATGGQRSASVRAVLDGRIFTGCGGPVE